MSAPDTSRTSWSVPVMSALGCIADIGRWNPLQEAIFQVRPAGNPPRKVLVGIDLRCPLFPRKRTWRGYSAMSALCRFCSLIPGLGVKLSTIILAGPTVLSAVEACPPHDGVRRRWRINVANAVAFSGVRKKSGDLTTATVPAGTSFPAVSREPCDLVMPVTRKPPPSTS